MARAIRREDDPKPFLPQVGNQLGGTGQEPRPLPDRPIKIKGETSQVPQRLEDRARLGLSHAILSISLSDFPGPCHGPCWKTIHWLVRKSLPSYSNLPTHDQFPRAGGRAELDDE